MNNKRALLVDLKERLGCSEEECLIINDVIEDTFIFGKKNKLKMINAFTQRLHVSEDRAEEIYDTFMDIFKTRIKYKLRHPFKSIDFKKED
jgi:3-deoxy-D-manno-octulosonate 8-phosphate phosphatase KdsC-like HAD superfamily phosphatase